MNTPFVSIEGEGIDDDAVKAQKLFGVVWRVLTPAHEEALTLLELAIMLFDQLPKDPVSSFAKALDRTLQRLATVYDGVFEAHVDTIRFMMWMIE